jgi:hypothetical protein
MTRGLVFVRTSCNIFLFCPYVWFSCWSFAVHLSFTLYVYASVHVVAYVYVYVRLQVSVYMWMVRQRWIIPCTGILQAQTVPRGWGYQISRQIDTWSGKVVGLMHRPSLPPRKYSYKIKYVYFRELVEPRAMVWLEALCQWKIPVTVWIRTRDLPACSTVSKQNAPMLASSMYACAHLVYSHFARPTHTHTHLRVRFAANWICIYITEELKYCVLSTCQWEMPAKSRGLCCKWCQRTGGGTSVVDDRQTVKRDVGVRNVCQSRHCMSCSVLLILCTCSSLYLSNETGRTMWRCM